jgi:hypothetical protein
VCGGCARGKGAVDWLVYYLGQRAYLPTCVYACFEGLGKGLSAWVDFRPGGIAQMAHARVVFNLQTHPAIFPLHPWLIFVGGGLQGFHGGKGGSSPTRPTARFATGPVNYKRCIVYENLIFANAQLIREQNRYLKQKREVHIPGAKEITCSKHKLMG